MTLKKVKKALQKEGLPHIHPSSFRDSVRLEGRVKTWEQYIQAGFAAANRGFKGVINDIEVEGIEKFSPSLPLQKNRDLEGKKADVVIIGGGVIGAATARELSRKKLKIVLIEKEADLARQASGRNNGMIHPSFSPPPGSKKAEYNARGNELFSQEALELGLEIKWPGALILLPNYLYRFLAPAVYKRAKKNHIPSIEYWSPSKVQKEEPYVYPKQRGGFFIPAAGIISPYKLTIAYGENAISNGAEFFLETAATGFIKENNRLLGVETTRGRIFSKTVINAAGIWSDYIASLAGDRFFTIHPRRGALAILDSRVYPYNRFNLGIFNFSSRRTKGGGICPTVDGNLLLGPNAEEVPSREDFSTYPHDIEHLRQHHFPLNKVAREEDIITYFSGTRACTFEEEFIIEPSEHIENLIHAAGIQSPGLASAPAIARDVAEMALENLRGKTEIKPNPDFNPAREKKTPVKIMSSKEKNKTISSRPDYGRIICRCEGISEGEVRDALRSPLPVYTLDGLKMRVRAGMGRCQGSFCTPRLLKILQEESKKPITSLSKDGTGSELIVRHTKNIEGEDDFNVAGR